MTLPGFWDEPERAQKIVQQKKLCVQVVDPIDRLSQVIEDGHVLMTGPVAHVFEGRLSADFLAQVVS